MLEISMYLLSSGHEDFCSVEHKCSMGAGNCHDDNQCKSVKILLSKHSVCKATNIISGIEGTQCSVGTDLRDGT